MHWRSLVSRIQRDSYWTQRRMRRIPMGRIWRRNSIFRMNWMNWREIWHSCNSFKKMISIMWSSSLMWAHFKFNHFITTSIEKIWYLQTLGSFHPSGPAAYQEEVSTACALLTKVQNSIIHLTSFSPGRSLSLLLHGSWRNAQIVLVFISYEYPACILRCHPGIQYRFSEKLKYLKIKAQFARRCAQFCAIVTTAPLVHIGILNMSTMPEGEIRMWYILYPDQYFVFNNDAIILWYMLILCRCGRWLRWLYSYI